MNYTTIVTSMPTNDLVGDYYEAMLLFLESEEIGTDSIIECFVESSDEMYMIHPQKGYSQYLKTEAPPLASLHPGEYSFEQLLFTPSSKTEFLPLCLKFVSKELHQKSSTLYIRLYKEKRFEIVVQFFLPFENSSL